MVGYTLAKCYAVLDTAVLCPVASGLGSAFCVFCAFGTQALYLVESGASEDPAVFWVLSGHMQLSNSASHIP